MRDRVNRLFAAQAGNAGTQGDFLDECWEAASPGHSGTRGNTGTRSSSSASQPSCVSERSQERRERNSAESVGDSALRSRVPADSTQYNDGNWAADARRLIEALPDQGIRQVLIDFYDEAAALIAFEKNCPPREAEQHAFGLLLFQILRRGVDAKTVPTLGIQT